MLGGGGADGGNFCQLLLVYICLWILLLSVFIFPQRHTELLVQNFEQHAIVFQRSDLEFVVPREKRGLHRRFLLVLLP